jgi:peptidoglycan hydrolase CwlO-like protein
MKRWLFLLLTVVTAVFFLTDRQIRAQTPSPSDWQNNLNAIDQKINDLRSKLSEVQTQKNTITNKIAFYNGQIQLTEFQIEQTEIQISSLSGRIQNLEDRLNHLSDVFRQRTEEGYRLSLTTDPLAMFLSSENFPLFIEQIKYIRTVQASDRLIMLQLEETRTNYDDQKTLAEILAKKLESQRQTLDQQRKESSFLLEKYKSDEKTYQDQLAAALAEQAAMESALSRAINLLQNGTPVTAGTAIATIGNSGAPVCSTGKHLHFEIRKDSTAVSPANYLKNTSVVWDNQPDGSFNFTGSWDWPIQDPRIEQGFGSTYWSRLGWYGGGIHTGIDMVSQSSDIIRAPVGGTLYKGTSSCRGIPMNFVAIDAGGGIIIWFWHVQ